MPHVPCVWEYPNPSPFSWDNFEVSQNFPVDRISVVHSSGWHPKALFIDFFHLPTFPPYFSWDHLPDNLLALKSLFQSLFLGNRNPETRLVSGECKPD